MLSIRLARVGRTNLPSYRLVVQEKTRSPKSKVIEILGHYDPKTEPAKLVAKKERLDHWLKVGAQPTVSAAEILIKQDLIKLEQAAELKREHVRREKSKKRLAGRREWQEKVTKLKKERAEVKQKAQGKKEAVTEKPKEAPTEEKAPEKK